MKVLGALIIEKCDAKLWDPLRASRERLAFSHLFFADNLVLFAKADTKNCLTVRDVLKSFYSLSSQKVSNANSSAFFSLNVKTKTRVDLCEILEFRSTLTLGKYLGFPIKILSMSRDYRFIIERIQIFLARWKANLLSFAGRLVLTQSIITTIPNYMMQCMALPTKVLRSVDQLS